MDADTEDDVFYTDPYDFNDARNEPRPDSVIYQPIFKELKELNQECASLFSDPLTESPYHNIITTGLLRDVQNRTKQDFPEEAMFAIAGDMESGKSSVINSILSLGVIARKGNSGGSCTWVVQRFMKTFVDQNAPFAAKVYFFSTEEIRKIVSTGLARYYHAAGLDRAEPEEPEDADHSAQDFTDRNTTMDTFMALFCDQEEFETRPKAEAFLATASSEADEDMLELLTGWASDLVASHLDRQEYVSVTGSTADDLLWTLQPYTYTPVGVDANGLTAAWPLVSVIDFGLNHPLLNEGIILVDAPGKSDANSTRAGNAVEWHRKCTHKILVAQIGRITDNQSVREELASGFHTRGSGNIMLVLTHGDEYDGDSNITGTPLEKRQELKLRDETKALNQEKRKLNQRRQRPGTSQDEKDDLLQDVKTRKQIRSDRQFNFMALDPFLRNYSLERPNITKAVEEAKKKLRREMSNVQNEILVPSEQAYIVRAMMPVYAEVRLLRGAGAPQKRIDTFERKVATTSGIWITVQEMVAQSLVDLYHQNMVDLACKLELAFDGIQDKFNLMCEDTVVKGEAEKRQEEELREKLQKGLLQAKELLEGPIRKAADACRNYSTSSLFVN
ncbi:hypothetical protein LTR36_000141 [Oleoguttula mirabilis]|uniref:DUF7605 domain-containing protein n=1 Tax=Oleoguttula mirabilis TaxID=1507867 RepID=A0AAV9JZG1_9PEZI|nr:hypothetical protein LTR36_000141 [Oleoguttula mirabilis]